MTAGTPFHLQLHSHFLVLILNCCKQSSDDTGCTFFSAFTSSHGSKYRGPLSHLSWRNVVFTSQKSEWQSVGWTLRPVLCTGGITFFFLLRKHLLCCVKCPDVYRESLSFRGIICRSLCYYVQLLIGRVSACLEGPVLHRRYHLRVKETPKETFTRLCCCVCPNV